MTAAEPLQHDILDELHSIIEAHGVWLQHDGRQGRRANLSGWDLQGIDFRNAYLPEANFRGANLRGANLSGATLQGADFAQSNIENTNFMDSRLDGSNFSRCEGMGAYFNNATMVGCNFSSAIMECADFTNTKVAGGKFREAFLVQAKFTNSDLDCAIMRYVNASEAIFNGANLQQADCRDTNFKYAQFREANLNGAGMRKANLDHVSFSHANFSKAIDLDPGYQVRSIEAEKQEVMLELKNLGSMREEISHYEERVNEQKKQIRLKRKVLEGLNEMEGEVSDGLGSYMRMFRSIAIFWFVVVAVAATIISYRTSKVGFFGFEGLDSTTLAAGVVAVLLGHVVSALLALHAAKRFANYVRVRHEKLILLENDNSIQIDTGEPPITSTMSSPQNDEEFCYDDAKVTYL